MKKFFIMLLLLLSIYASGCADSETKIVSSKNPDASEILALEKNADLFQWNNIVYKTDVDWVNDLKLSKEKQLGEITESYSEHLNEFKNGMATKLQKGSKIFMAKERGDILIVEDNGKVKYYLALVEG